MVEQTAVQKDIEMVVHWVDHLAGETVATWVMLLVAAKVAMKVAGLDFD